MASRGGLQRRVQALGKGVGLLGLIFLSELRCSQEDHLRADGASGACRTLSAREALFQVPWPLPESRSHRSGHHFVKHYAFFRICLYLLGPVLLFQRPPCPGGGGKA
jgi:hypothetical protein